MTTVNTFGKGSHRLAARLVTAVIAFAALGLAAPAANADSSKSPESSVQTKPMREADWPWAA